MEKQSSKNEQKTPPKEDTGSAKTGDLAKDIEENKAITFLSYIGILFLVPLLAKKDSKFAQFHAKQGMILFIGVVIVSFINVIPILGQLIYFLALLFAFILMIMGLVQVAKGEMKKLPIIGDIAEKINI